MHAEIILDLYLIKCRRVLKGKQNMKPESLQKPVLDPAIQSFLDGLAKLNLPPIYKVLPEQA